MKRGRFLLIILLMLVLLILQLNRNPTEEEIVSDVLTTEAGEYQYEVLATGLEAPWEIAVLPEGVVIGMVSGTLMTWTIF